MVKDMLYWIWYTIYMIKILFECVILKGAYYEFKGAYISIHARKIRKR